MTDRRRTLGGLSAHALKDALHRLRSLADDGADVAERSAFATQRLHLGDNFLLFTVGNEPLDLAIHDDFRAEWPFAPAEHVLSGQMARMRSRSPSATAARIVKTILLMPLLRTSPPSRSGAGCLPSAVLGYPARPLLIQRPCPTWPSRSRPRAQRLQARRWPSGRSASGIAPDTPASTKKLATCQPFIMRKPVICWRWASKEQPSSVCPVVLTRQYALEPAKQLVDGHDVELWQLAER